MIGLKTYWPETDLAEPDEIHGLMSIYLRGDDPVEKWQAHVRDDGCVNFATKDDDGEYQFAFHICSMRSFMARMEELMIRSKLAFGEQWGEK